MSAPYVRSYEGFVDGVYTNPPVSGTWYQNTYGTQNTVAIRYTLTSGASASDVKVELSIDSVTDIRTWADPSMPAGGPAATEGVIVFPLLRDWYFKCTATNAVIVAIQAIG